MSKVIMFSRYFPKGHPRFGAPTYFVEKIWAAIKEPTGNHLDIPDINLWEYLHCYPKNHTIRAGCRFKAGDKFSPRVWSGKPYRSKQIKIAPDIVIKKTFDFEIDLNGVYSINGKYISQQMYPVLSQNDGLAEYDMQYWFMPDYTKPKEFKGQIICWDESINY
jgi:hypothetical protein